MITDGELDQIEKMAIKDGHLIYAKLVTELRHYQHEVNNPNYLYSGARIHRQSILSREAQIDLMSAEIAKLRKLNEELIERVAGQSELLGKKAEKAHAGKDPV